MQHDRRWRAAILADIARAEPLRHDEIELQGAALPVAAERVAQHEFELRPVERALAGVERVGEAGGLDRVLQILLGAVPDASLPARTGGRSANLTVDIVEAEIAVDRQQQFAERDRFAVTWSSVQKMCASSWVKARTRMMPCNAPDGSLRWQLPNSASRSGNSR